MSSDDPGGGLPDAPVPDGPMPDGAVRVEQRRPTPLYRWLSARLLRLEAWVRSHGSANIRWATRVGWALVIGIGILLLAGPVINRPIGFDDITASAEGATDTWIARSFAADYTLARSADGRLRVEVTERITAFFPDDVDEDAVERVIPSQYESHDLDPTLVSATFDGAETGVDTVRAPTRTTFRIQRDSPLTGDHELVLRYTLSDLAYPAENASTGRIEDLLEWNVFGPDFPHGVAHSALTVTVPRALVADYSRQPHGGISWLAAERLLTARARHPDRRRRHLLAGQRPEHPAVRDVLVPVPLPAGDVHHAGPLVPVLGAGDRPVRAPAPAGRDAAVRPGRTGGRVGGCPGSGLVRLPGAAAARRRAGSRRPALAGRAHLGSGRGRGRPSRRAEVGGSAAGPGARRGAHRPDRKPFHRLVALPVGAGVARAVHAGSAAGAHRLRARLVHRCGPGLDRAAVGTGASAVIPGAAVRVLVAGRDRGRHHGSGRRHPRARAQRATAHSTGRAGQGAPAGSAPVRAAHPRRRAHVAVRSACRMR
ncbi:hypothetical protein [Microbacterium elymi]|uniref:DUF2207 domain-containing protein n=1 Tax=Microbacterium elymi TaxID=2909587 RepID=A0ABY5NJ19_9MICO|nr:hypothetical protein [Microbacterium elymi]UUT35124.1 hypothetical protein L2X98_33255 [Microbacterium elymi]